MSGSATSAASTQNGTGKTLPPEIEAALNQVTEINSLPEVTTKIVEVVEDERATAHDMHEIVRTDPALAAKILKVVNSAFYGLPAQIGSLDRAILMLGLSAVKNIALAASLSRMFKADAISSQFAARDLWRHCVAVGVCARELAQSHGKEFSDEAFVGGLVHDLGLITAQQIFSTQVQEVAERCFNEPQDYCAAEQATIGADHQVFGEYLGRRWKFPPRLRHTLSSHHTPLAVEPDHQKMVATIYIADTLCCRGQYGFWLTAANQEIQSELMEIVGVSDEQIGTLMDELPTRIRDAEKVFAD